MNKQRKASKSAENLAIETSRKIDHSGLCHLSRSYYCSQFNRPHSYPATKSAIKGKQVVVQRQFDEAERVELERKYGTFGTFSHPVPLEVIEKSSFDIPAIDLIGKHRTLPAWKRAFSVHKVAAAHAALVQHGRYVVFTLHLDPSLANEVEEKPSWIKDHIMGVLRDKFTASKVWSGEKFDGWFVIENSPARERACELGRRYYHLHGAVRLPLGGEDVKQELRRILLSVNKGRYQGPRNGEQLYLSSVVDFLPGMPKERRRTSGKPAGELGWAFYSGKEIKDLTERLGVIPFAISRSLTRAGRQIYEQHRSQSASALRQAEAIDGINALARWALDDIREARFEAIFSDLAKEHDRLMTSPGLEVPKLIRRARALANSPVTRTELFQAVVAIVQHPEMQDVRPIIRNHKELLIRVGSDLTYKHAARCGARALKESTEHLHRGKRTMKPHAAEKAYRAIVEH